MNKTLIRPAVWMLLTAGVTAQGATTQRATTQGAAAPQIEFELHTTGTRILLKGATRKPGEEKPPKPGAEKFETRSRISLRVDSISWLDLESSVETILDRKRERLIFLDHEKRRFRTRSLLGWIAALDQERANRVRIASVLRGAGVDVLQESFTTFWLESLFGFGRDAAGEVTIADGDGKLACKHKDELVLEATLGDTKLPEALAASFERFVIRSLKIHPAIRDRLVALDAIPRRIRHRSYNAGTRTDTVLEVRAWPPTDEKVPLAATVDIALALTKYTAWVDPKDNLDKLLDDIAAKRIETKTLSKAWYADLVRQTAKDGKHLDAFLILLESSFAHADTSIRELAQAIKMDSKNVTPLLRIMQLGEKDAAAAEKAIRALEREGLRGTATLDILRANYLTGMKRSRDAEKLLLAVLRERPWLAGPFKDLGDIYAKRFEMPRAWRCWERAFDLAPKHPLLRDFVRLRADLRKRYAGWL